MNKDLKEKWNTLLDSLSYQIKEPVLSEEEILNFERNNEITLPDDYRYFLMNIGNGIIIKNVPSELYLGGIKRPIEKQINKRLKLDFPFKETYKSSDEYPDYYHQGKNFKGDTCITAKQKLKYNDTEALNMCRNCKHLDECNDADWKVFHGEDFDGYLDEDSIPYYNGSLCILDMGFEDQYRIILNGPHRGEVWINYWELEFSPVTKTFYDFLIAYKNQDDILKNKNSGALWNFGEEEHG